MQRARNSQSTTLPGIAGSFAVNVLARRFPASSAFSGANRAPKLIHDLARGADSRGVLVHVERDGAHASVSASSIALANLCQVDHGIFRGPWIRSDRNFHPEAAFAKSHAIDGLGMQVIGNELVVALEILIGDVKKNRSVGTLRALLENFNRDLMAAQNRRQKRTSQRLLHNRPQNFRP